MRKTILISLIASVLLIGFNACADDSVSADEVCEISLPSAFVHANIDATYFQENEKPNETQYSVYNQVAEIATFGSSLLESGEVLNLATGALGYAQSIGVQPDFESGSCVWAFNIPEVLAGDSDLFVTVFATDTGSMIEWEIEATGIIFGEEMEDFRFITGTTAPDESSGVWNVYSGEAGNTPILSYSWDIESENVYEAEFTSLEMGAATYSKNHPENNMTVVDDVTTEINIYWNEETDSGWIEAEGQDRTCYEDFINAAC